MPRSRISRSIMPLLLVALVGCSVLAWMAVPARAIEIPPAGLPTFVQTNGPTAAIGLGDWYTNSAKGAGNGYHYFTLNVPCGWPATLPVMIDLFSPEMNATNKISDEVSSTPGPTTFELYAPGTKVGPAPNVPLPGSGIPNAQVVYQPKSTPEQWVRFYALAAPVQCGRYILRSQASGDDQNGWRLRIGYDNDNDPTNPLPANYDNPDGIAGTGDELTIGVIQTMYQNEVIQFGVGQCLTLFQYVDPGLKETFFHNFDLDKVVPPATPPAQRVRYYSPLDTYDPLALTGGTAGTVSGPTVWDATVAPSTNIQRGTGDRIADPVGGWWRIVTCVNNHNEYLQEGQTGIPTYSPPQPPTPVLTITKDDGIIKTEQKHVQTYALNFANTSDTTATPGAAFDVVLTDTLPPNATYVSCSIDAPLTGTCTQQNGVVIYHIDGIFVAGARGSAKVTVQVAPDAKDKVINNVTITGKDQLGNILPPVLAQDIDTLDLGPSAITLDHFSATRLNDGVQVAWTTSAEHDTWSFQVLRSDDANQAHAIRVTAAPILARGNSTSGASYSWTDSTTLPNQRYTYWLQEIARDGTTTVYGPATSDSLAAARSQRVLLPVVVK